MKRKNSCSPGERREAAEVSGWRTHQPWHWFPKTSPYQSGPWPLQKTQPPGRFWSGACEERPWCRERLKAGGEGDDRGWDGWMASPPWWTWVWGSSGSWWGTGKPGVLLSMGPQRVGHDWTELSWNPWIRWARFGSCWLRHLGYNNASSVDWL